MSAAAQKLESVFNDIAATRMAGLPICNPVVRVQAVGFRAWQGLQVGVLVTPWSLSLVLLPDTAEGLKVLGPDATQTWAFPSGEYPFMGFSEAALGVCQICPLISPLADIASHDEAVGIAHQVMSMLFNISQAESAQQIEHARMNGESLIEKPLSRRDFLRGGFWGK